MIFDFAYLLLFLSGLMILVENRLTRLISLLSFQGFLLIPTVLKVHPIHESHTWILISMVILFKAIVTPYILFWTARKAWLEESTTPRFGYLATAFFLVFGILIAIFLTERIQSFPLDTHRIGLIYVILVIYVGILGFIVQKNWMALIAGFVVFENGIFALTMVLDKGLPIGLEFGTFLDAVLVIVAAVVLKLNPLSLQEKG
ncbi:MAG: formate hydrogenase [Leptospiraceae bacterium]|jgi:hydrogenase-4 component E|nr:formate hydrogenase [Leptospiraceae bacterium]MCZ8347713.1 formate hydrogenase [Leptospiraceae bacterium]PJE04010.1 MAG: formate hydrogenase [Leptospira sp.]